MLVSMPLYKKVQRQLDRVLLTTRENLMGVRVIRAFNRQESERAAFEEENGSLVKMQVFVGRISALLKSGDLCDYQPGDCGGDLGGRPDGWTPGILTQGKVIALVNYMSQILVELIKMANLIILISKAAACMNRVDGVFAITSSVKEPAGRGSGREGGDARPGGAMAGRGPDRPLATENGAAAPAVEFQRTWRLPTPAREIRPLRASPSRLSRGETIGVIGGTGSGKTTLVNLIPRFYDAAEGPGPGKRPGRAGVFPGGASGPYGRGAPAGGAF